VHGSPAESRPSAFVLAPLYVPAAIDWAAGGSQGNPTIVRLKRGGTLEATILTARGEPAVGVVVSVLAASDSLTLGLDAAWPAGVAAAAPTEIRLRATVSRETGELEFDGPGPEALRYVGSTDSYGMVVFDGLPMHARLELRCYRALRVVGISDVVTLDTAGPTRRTWTLPRECAVRGRLRVDDVVSPDGSRLSLYPIADAVGGAAGDNEYKLIDPRASAGFVTWADALGRFEWAAVPEGLWWILIERADSARANVTANASALRIASKRRIGCDDDERLELDVPNTFSLGGWASMPSGEPAAGVEIALFGKHLAGSARAVSDARGRFDFAGLVRGTFFLSANHASGDQILDGLVEVAAGDMAVDLRLQQTSRRTCYFALANPDGVGMASGVLTAHVTCGSDFAASTATKVSDLIDVWRVETPSAGTLSLFVALGRERVAFAENVSPDETTAHAPVKLHLSPADRVKVLTATAERERVRFVAKVGTACVGVARLASAADAPAIEFVVPPRSAVVEAYVDGRLVGRALSPAGSTPRSALEWPRDFDVSGM
jgi:hypothetical protein